SPLYRRHRVSGAIISHCVWLYHRFNLSLRDIVELLAKDGISVSHESIRRWCRKFGKVFAEGLRRHRAQPADRWHLDEMQLKMRRTTHYLWRAVDRNGLVLGILVHARRNTRAALAFLSHILERVGRTPRVIVTDKLRSYGAALKRLLPQVEHRQH